MNVIEEALYENVLKYAYTMWEVSEDELRSLPIEAFTFMLIERGHIRLKRPKPDTWQAVVGEDDSRGFTKWKRITSSKDLKTAVWRTFLKLQNPPPSASKSHKIMRRESPPPCDCCGSEYSRWRVIEDTPRHICNNCSSSLDI